MLGRLVVHAGLHKTGTTSFQTACAGSRDLLISRGIYYPDWRGAIHHAAMVHDLANPGESAENVFSAICRSAADARCDTVLLSAETFSVINRARIQSFDICASEEFRDVEYLLVLRNPSQLIPSLVKQQLAHGAIGLGAQATDYARRTIRNIFSIVQKFSDLFRDRLQLLNFAELSADPQGLADALFRSAVDTAAPPGMLPNRRVNTSEGFFSDPYQIMTATIRGALAIRESQNPYSPEISQLLSSLVPRKKLDAWLNTIEMAQIGPLMTSAIGTLLEPVLGENLEELVAQFPATRETALDVSG